MVRKILPLLPPHRIYVEPFGGGASILLAKEPSPVEVYNDLNGDLVHFFRVLRNRRQFREFYRLAQLTPYARAEYNHCRATWQQTGKPVQRAWQWWVVARMGFSGQFGAGWSSAVTQSNRGMVGTCSDFLSTIDQLPQVVARLKRVQIEQSDFRRILDRYDSPQTLFYCDPPYVSSTRSNKKYACEMTDTDHRELVDRLLQLEGRAVVSGYAHPIYRPLQRAGWRVRRYRTACHAAAKTRATGILGPGAARKKQPRTETLWISPNGACR